MGYHHKTKQATKQAAKEQGMRLAKLAVANKLSVAQIAVITGASRATVYNWFAGNGVSKAYKAHVQALIHKLRTGTTEEVMELQGAKAYIPPLLLI
jgi:transcriptional regulator with XRE-family HTH domain